MAFRKKADFILTHKPDILIVPECEHPDKLKFNKETPLPSDVYGIEQTSTKVLEFSLITITGSNYLTLIIPTLKIFYRYL